MEIQIHVASHPLAITLNSSQAWEKLNESNDYYDIASLKPTRWLKTSV